MKVKIPAALFFVVLICLSVFAWNPNYHQTQPPPLNASFIINKWPPKMDETMFTTLPAMRKILVSEFNSVGLVEFAPKTSGAVVLNIRIVDIKTERNRTGLENNQITTCQAEVRLSPSADASSNFIDEASAFFVVKIESGIHSFSEDRQIDDSEHTSDIIEYFEKSALVAMADRISTWARYRIRK